MAGSGTPRPGDILIQAATKYAAAKAGDVVTNLGQRATSGGRDKSGGKSDDDGGDDSKGFVGTAVEKIGEGKSPVKAAMSGIGASIKGLFKRKGGSKRPTNIVEDCWVGVPPDVAFAAWTQWEEFASFTKGVENVTRGDETPEEELEEDQHPLEGEETGWTAKIFVNRRTWKSRTVDYDPPNRISWTSEGPKGTVDGTITFTALGENATLMLFVLEYRSKGPIEWIGNRWRTVGRRVRLDIKHFRRYVMRTEPDELPEPDEADQIGDQSDESEESDAPSEEGSELEEGANAPSEDEDGADAPSEEDSDSEEDPDAPSEEPDEPETARRRPVRRARG